MDVNGNALDAHDGQLARFGNTYCLYGASYTCGYGVLTDDANDLMFSTAVG